MKKKEWRIKRNEEQNYLKNRKTIKKKNGKKKTYKTEMKI